MVFYCGGFLYDAVGCLFLSWVVVVMWVDVEVVVVCVCGVCQNESIVGWSAVSGYLCLWEKSLSLGVSFCVGSSFLSFSRAFSTVRTPPPPAALISVVSLFCGM